MKERHTVQGLEALRHVPFCEESDRGEMHLGISERMIEACFDAKEKACPHLLEHAWTTLVFMWKRIDRWRT